MVLVRCKFRDLLFKVLIATRSSCAQLRNQICHGQGLKYYETLLDPDSAATGELPDEPEPLRLQDLELHPMDDHGLAVLDVADAGGENIPAALAHAPAVLDHLNARLRLCRNAAMRHLMKRFAPARKAVNSMVFRLSARPRMSSAILRRSSSMMMMMHSSRKTCFSNFLVLLHPPGTPGQVSKTMKTPCMLLLITMFRTWLLLFLYRLYRTV